MNALTRPEAHAASFRDPSGFVFTEGGTLYRHVAPAYREHYEHLMSSGLYDALVAKGLLVPHVEADARLSPGAWKVLRPETIPFVSYPYEWPFSALKAAALLTLAVQREALAHGMTLKDAPASNVQFRGAAPVLVDTLSFERYTDGDPWKPYRQFCQHFLAPLALMAKVDVRLGRLLALHVDGVPLDLASKLLPRRTRFSPGLALHVHAHARMQAKHGQDGASENRRAAPRLPRRSLDGILANLESVVRGLDWKPEGTEWADYYAATNYSDEAEAAKRRTVASMVDAVAPRTVWDLGSNTGAYSPNADLVVALDIDPAAVERNWRQRSAAKDAKTLPLVMDLANPSPGNGWGGAERRSLHERGPADLVLALALVHHLAIGNNVPLSRVAEEFARYGRHAVVEWVPKEDSQVARMLATREDVFPGYTQEGFEAAFAARFELVDKAPVAGSARTLYLWRRRG